MTEITTRADAEKSAMRGSRIKALLNGAEAARDAAVVRAGNLNKRRIERLGDELTEIQQALAKWAQDNRGEFADKKTLELKGALLNLRIGPRYLALVPTLQKQEDKEEGKGWKVVMRKLVRAGRVLLAWRLWVKIEFKLDKRKILSDSAGERPRLTADKLKSVGLQVCQDETLAIEFRVAAKP